MTLAPWLLGCQPPFNATGTYHGTWESRIYEPLGDETVITCPFSFILQHRGGILYPFNRIVYGVVSLDYTCFLESELGEWANYSSLEVPVFGHIEKSGVLKLWSGACTKAENHCVTLSMEATGRETTHDNYMDLCEGDAILHFAWEDREPFDLSVQFDAERPW